MVAIFHLAFHVTDLADARGFYGGVLECREGRSTSSWVDFDFFGHQLSLHLGQPFSATNTGRVDGLHVPIPHLGLIVELNTWHRLVRRLTDAEIEFVVPPTVRFAGEPGEQCTMFFRDPAGNPIEIKGFADFASVYAR